MGDDSSKIKKMMSVMGGIKRTINDLKSAKDMSARNKVSSGVSFGKILPYFVSMFIGISIYLYAGFTDLVDLLLDFVITNLPKLLSGFMPDTVLFGSFTLYHIVYFLVFALVVMLYFNFIFIWPTYLMYKDGDVFGREEIFKFEVWIIVGLCIVILLFSSLAQFQIDGKWIGMKDTIELQGEELEESLTYCILTTLDPIGCQDKKNSQAQVVDTVKYSLYLNKGTSRKDYKLRELKDYRVNYKYQTTGGYLVLDKFECYVGNTKGKPVYVKDLEGEIIKAQDVERSLVFNCDIGNYSLEKQKVTDFKIIPVLYYYMSTEIIQDVPIVNMADITDIDEQIEAEEKYIIALKGVTEPGITNTIFSAKVTSVPQWPVFYINDDNQKEYTVNFDISKSSKASQFGSIQDSFIEELSVPSQFIYDCGNENKNCSTKLITPSKDSNSMSYFEINMRLKDEPQTQYSIERLYLKIKSYMKKQSTITINVEDSDWEEKQEQQKKEQEESKEEPKTTPETSEATSSDPKTDETTNPEDSTTLKTPADEPKYQDDPSITQ